MFRAVAIPAERLNIFDGVAAAMANRDYVVFADLSPRITAPQACRKNKRHSKPFAICMGCY
jgi:hypothetical protein